MCKSNNFILCAFLHGWKTQKKWRPCLTSCFFFFFPLFLTADFLGALIPPSLQLCWSKQEYLRLILILN